MTLPSARASLTPFFLLSTTLSAGHGVMLTVLDDYRDRYGISEGALGLVIGISFFTSFLAAVTIGPLADRGHARRLVMIGLTLDVVGLVLTAASTSFATLSAGRLITGIGVGMATPAIRRIVVVSDPTRLGHNMGRLLAFDVAGLAFGPVTSAALAEPFGVGVPFLVVAGSNLVLVPWLLRVQVIEQPDDATRERFAWTLLRHRPYASAVILGCTVYLMVGTFDSLWALALTDLGAGSWLISIGVTVFALPLILLGTQGGRLAQQLGPWRLATMGLLTGSAFMVSYGHLPTAALMFAAVMVHSFTDGLTLASAGVAVGMSAPRERQAAAQGLLSGLQTLTAGCSAVMAGSLYEHVGRAGTYTATGVGMATMVLVARLLVRGTPYARMSRAPDPVGASPS